MDAGSRTAEDNAVIRVDLEKIHITNKSTFIHGIIYLRCEGKMLEVRLCVKKNMIL